MRTEYFLVNLFVLLFLGIGSFFDMKSKEIPELLLFIFAVLGIVINLLLKYQSFFEVMLGVSEGILLLALGKITGEAVGYGDGYAVMILGIFKGGSNAFLVVCIAFVLSAVFGSLCMAAGKWSLKDRMAFFPFLFFAAIGGIFL